jgi:hypothetical protein
MQRLMLALLLTLTITANAQDWELKKEENGILVYTKDNGTTYPSVQSVTVIKTSMSEAVALIMNVEKFPEWIYKCKSAKVLEKKSENELIHYQVNSVPIKKDRDMIIQLTKTEESTGDVIITQKGLPQYMPEKEDLVRVPRLDGKFQLRTVENGIEVKYTIDTEPGAGLPEKLVRRAMVEGPFQTAANMKKILEQNVVAKKRKP